MTLTLPSRLARRVLPATLCLLAFQGNAAYSQLQQASPRSTADDTASATPSQNSTSTNLSSRTALSAAEIDQILQQHPELVPELKSVLADTLQQQGIRVQADAITDDTLTRQIASSSDLRAGITEWLRARGYVSDAELHRSLTTSSDNNVDRRDSLNGPDPLTASRNDADSFPSSSPNDERLQDRTTTNRRAPATTPLQRADTSARKDTTRSSTDKPEVLHVPAPYNLLAMRDLYTQLPQDDTNLRRFGSDVFINRDDPLGDHSASIPRDLPMDVPVGPDYVLGTGDGLTITLSGGLSQSFTRVIDREGKIALPEAGAIVLAGLTLQHAQEAVQAALRQQFRDARVDLAIARLRTVRVYVTGDVQRPGAYDLSSLSTTINALYAAGGPTSVGSLRIVRHMRGAQLIREIDLYDFLLHGLRGSEERLQAGDTLLVPPAGPQVAVYGMVRRAAIYELKANTTLAELLTDAGGATVTAALNHITIDRVQPNQQRETVNVDLPASAPAELAQQRLTAVAVKDGDRIHVGAILPYSQRAVYVQGHVARPGKLPFHDGMTLADVIRSYQDLLPEPAAIGDIIRLVPPDLHPEAIEFNVADALIGNVNLPLQPFDTVRIFGRYEQDAPHVTIRGEVQHPGEYAFPAGMTAAQLVRMAGGLKRDALIDSADLASYTVQNGEKTVSQRTEINIGAALLANNRAADTPLKPGDILTIHQISGWNDIGASVTLDGEVKFPGSYGLQEGERLSSVLRRAGGLRGTAYADGAILVRTQVRQLEEKSRLELIHQIETSAASARLAPNLAGDQAATIAAAEQQQNEVLQRLRSQPASGRLVIHVSADIDSWANTDADIEMRSGDVLTVPKQPGFVLVSGQVYNASAITFVPGKKASWYLDRAGSTNEVANRKEIFIVRANGLVIGKRSGGWSDSVLSTRMNPGDVIVVPQKIIGGSLLWRNLLTVAQITSSIAITAAVAGVL